MTSLRMPPRFLTNLLTLGIARARWIAEANTSLGQGGAGLLFAWFLLPFANYGVVGRLNSALHAAGSNHSESQMLAFFLTGWPLIGATKRVRRATERLNDAHAIGQRAAVAA